MTALFDINLRGCSLDLSSTPLKYSWHLRKDFSSLYSNTFIRRKEPSLFQTRVIAHLKHPLDARFFLKSASLIWLNFESMNWSSASEIKSMVVTLMMVLSGVEIVMAKNFRSVYLINYYQWYWVISIKLILFFFLVINMLLVNGAISSAGEHYIDIVGVTGSIPVSPTTRQKGDVLLNHSNHYIN